PILISTEAPRYRKRFTPHAIEYSACGQKRMPRASASARPSRAYRTHLRGAFPLAGGDADGTLPAPFCGPGTTGAGALAFISSSSEIDASCLSIFASSLSQSELIVSSGYVTIVHWPLRPSSRQASTRPFDARISRGSLTPSRFAWRSLLPLQSIPLDLLVQIRPRHVEAPRRLRHIPVHLPQLRQEKAPLGRL